MQENRNPKKYGYAQSKDMPEVIKKAKQKIEGIKSSGLSTLPADDLIDIANKVGEHFAKTLKTTQIRRFLDSIRRLDVQFNKGKDFKKDMVILIKPKLAYAVGRNRDIKPLMEVLEPAITAGAKEYEDFKMLVSLIEGIVAYHRYHGGKDS